MRRITLDGNSAEQEHFHLIHVEQVLAQSNGPMEAVAALAMALLQDAEEEKSLLCDGNDAEAGNRCTLLQEASGEKRYYRIYTSVRHLQESKGKPTDAAKSADVKAIAGQADIPESEDRILVSMDEFFDRMEEGGAGFLFNPGTSSELAVDPEMVPFLWSMIRLSVNREMKRFFSDSEQVTEAAGQFTWT